MPTTGCRLVLAGGKAQPTLPRCRSLPFPRNALPFPRNEFLPHRHRSPRSRVVGETVSRCRWNHVFHNGLRTLYVDKKMAVSVFHPGRAFAAVGLCVGPDPPIHQSTINPSMNQRINEYLGSRRLITHHASLIIHHPGEDSEGTHAQDVHVGESIARQVLMALTVPLLWW